MRQWSLLLCLKKGCFCCWVDSFVTRGKQRRDFRTDWDEIFLWMWTLVWINSRSCGKTKSYFTKFCLVQLFGLVEIYIIDILIGSPQNWHKWYLVSSKHQIVIFFYWQMSFLVALFSINQFDNLFKIWRQYFANFLYFVIITTIPSSTRKRRNGKRVLFNVFLIRVLSPKPHIWIWVTRIWFEKNKTVYAQYILAPEVTMTYCNSEKRLLP